MKETRIVGIIATLILILLVICMIFNSNNAAVAALEPMSTATATPNQICAKIPEITPTPTAIVKIIPTPKLTPKTTKKPAQKAAPKSAAKPSKPGEAIPKQEADAIAISTMRELGLTDAEIDMAWDIHMHESVEWDGTNGYDYGGWQIEIAVHGVTIEQACDPAWSTRWIVGYMRGRYGSIEAAWEAKKSKGWY